MNLNLSKTFIIGDPHFGDTFIHKLERSDTFKNVDIIDNTIIDNINRLVKEDDTLIINGDVSMHSMEDAKRGLSKLNVKNRILVRGNHDTFECMDDIRTALFWNDCGFQVVTDILVVNDRIVITHKPPEYFSAQSKYIYVYAHTHSCPLYPLVGKNSACVSAEKTKYEPMSMSVLIHAVENFF